MTPDTSLRSYHAIYVVIMGTGLSIATTRVMEQLNAKQQPLAPKLLILAALVIFVLTAIAFYEGTHEHWKETHERVSEVNESVTFIDCVTGIGHAICFTGAGYVIAAPDKFAWAFVCLLIYDIAASLLLSTIYCMYRPRDQARGHLRDFAKRPKKWALVNTISLIVIFAIGVEAAGNLDLGNWLRSIPTNSDGDWSSSGARIYYGFILVFFVRVGIDLWLSHKIRKTNSNPGMI